MTTPLSLPADFDKPDSLQRRHLLKLMAASIALGAAGCSGPSPEKILPYVHSPEYAVPGEAIFYATALQLGSYARGVLVKNVDGRPIKVEGNPLHPASFGGTDIFAQARILDLWDPTRSQSIIHNTQPSSYASIQDALNVQLKSLEEAHGAGLRILTRTICSPVMANQLHEILNRYPQARWHQYDPLHDDHTFDATQRLFGKSLQPLFHFDVAERIVTFDADFLQGGPASVRYARDFSMLRNPDHGTMSRVFAIESTPGLIGAAADERIALTPFEIELLIRRLAKRFDVLGEINAAADSSATHITGFESKLVSELTQYRGKCVLVPGSRLSVDAHALVHELNIKLAATDHCLQFIEPVEARAENHINSLSSLCTDMATGKVNTLLILDGNPVYDAPSDFNFAQCLKAVPFSLHLAMYRNETSMRCNWHIPQTHEFEHWSDLRAFDGTTSIVQPLLAPLYNGCSPHRLLSWLLPPSLESAYDIVRQFYQHNYTESDFEHHWKTSLHNGMIAGSAAAPVNVTSLLNTSHKYSTLKINPSNNLTLIFSADDSVRDGEYANNAWLQELPRPLSKLTWDNAAIMNPLSAANLHVDTGQLIEITTAHGSIIAPVWIQPGHAEHCVTLHLGYGRTAGVNIATTIGFNAYTLRRSDDMWNTGIISIKHVEGIHVFANTQEHARMIGRDLVRSATFAEFLKTPKFATAKPEQRVPDESLYKDYPYDGYRWAMTINLNACIGCNACTIACQAENNIPSVGKQQVQLGREMHWIRVDRYYTGDEKTLRTDFQPVPCMHCERAPCEEVCPVGATVHDSEGINVQVYNRCVGTRFCSNNCPYKVRRFNFLQYANNSVESIKALQNPDVTVRQRGVMEKCNYCLQRITRARIEADRLGRRIHDGEVVTACQAACPTSAISFGDLNDPQAQLHQSKSSPRNYSLLAELNTRPRTTYLARVINSMTTPLQPGDSS